MSAAAETEQIKGQTEIAPKFEDGPVGRLEKKAHDKDQEVYSLEDEGDAEGADIARLEADALRREADDLRAKLAADADAPTQAETLKEEAADPVAGDMPPADPGPKHEPLAEDIIVAGLEMEPIDVGGKKPTSGVLRLTGGSVKLMHGTYLPGGIALRFSGTAVVSYVGKKDIHDSATQQVVDAVQQHSARITSLSVEIPE